MFTKWAISSNEGFWVLSSHWFDMMCGSRCHFKFKFQNRTTFIATYLLSLKNQCGNRKCDVHAILGHNYSSQDHLSQSLLHSDLITSLRPSVNVQISLHRSFAAKWNLSCSQFKYPLILSWTTIFTYVFWYFYRHWDAFPLPVDFQAVCLTPWGCEEMQRSLQSCSEYQRSVINVKWCLHDLHRSR